MALGVDANGAGAGEGTHVSVHAPILPGKYDAGLEWPFVGMVSITLLNQLEDKNHHMMSIDISNGQVNSPPMSCSLVTFVGHSLLVDHPVQNAQYLKDDTLYFRVSVEVANHKPWLECVAK